MWGFFAALISGALMPVGIYRLGTAFGLCSLCSGVAFYGETEYCGIVADRK